ncbi:MAG: hypothetical protein ABIW82_05250 [Dokdonella sp.]
MIVSPFEEISTFDAAWPKHVAALEVAAHAYHLGSIPRGFYVDESSIGYNAWRIASTGRDEHGVAWPLYFEAFGEYKNPVYIYVLAGIYWIFGISESATRAASCVAWIVGSIFLYALCTRLTSDRWLRLYAIVCVGFTPWLFSLSLSLSRRVRVDLAVSAAGYVSVGGLRGLYEKIRAIRSSGGNRDRAVGLCVLDISPSRSSSCARIAAGLPAAGLHTTACPADARIPP